MNKEQKLIIFAFLVLTFFVFPLFILGENAHIRVHDNLDSNLSWYTVLAKSGQLTGPTNATIAQIINGNLSRNAFGTEFSLIVWLYALFPTMIAYALSQTITRFVAFIGMFLLLKKHFLPGKGWEIINIGTALDFALTPFWPSGMLSTLGMPLALWAFLNIRKGEGLLKNYLILTLIPFYSSVVLGFFFFLCAMGIFWIVDVIRQRRWNWRFLFSIAYMSIVYLIVEYRLVFSILFGEPNSRDEYFHTRLSFWHSVQLTFKNFILGHNHVMTVHTFVILPVMLLALFFVVKKSLWKQEKTFIILFCLNFGLSAWYAFWFYKGWQPLTERFHFLNTFNFARFHFLRPLVVYLLFALSLKILYFCGEFSRKATAVLVVLQLIVVSLFNEEIIFHDKPSVKQFFAVEQFSDIKKHINLPQDEYRVASIGIHPAIAQYNGFYTLDTYNNFYPLSYKYQFREIIEKELAKNKTIKTYFDEWGGRCYVFTDELGKHYMFNKNSKKRLKNLELNIEPFKAMGGRYIFSAVPIDNASENSLELEKVFESNSSVWKIYLYKAI
ncbi:DUF6044 family protein [Heyndrickxia sp. NPDC080065]|uniref:DUF6044 family protein n=1 Tax=Heyndrickxia sp. NPDC080065 TaxID=3390568 RepID=UPI003D094C3D